MTTISFSVQFPQVSFSPSLSRSQQLSDSLLHLASSGKRWAAVGDTLLTLEFRIHILIRQLAAGASESCAEKNKSPESVYFPNWKTVLPDRYREWSRICIPLTWSLRGSKMTTRGANVIWFRHGLRLHDNPALLAALADKDQGIALIPVFIFDGESAGKSSHRYYIDPLNEYVCGAKWP